MSRYFRIILCLLVLIPTWGTSHAQQQAVISPNIFFRGLELVNGVRYTASVIKPTDATEMRNISVEITLPSDAPFTEMLVSRQVQFDVIRRNSQGQLTLIWQISRVAAETPLDPFAFTLAAPLAGEVEFYMHWQDETGQTFVDNFIEQPPTVVATASEFSMTPDSVDFSPVGDTGIQVALNSTNPLDFRVLATNFNPPPEYGQIWWCSLLELNGLNAGDVALVLVPLRRPVAPFTELFLFQQQADESWVALSDHGIVTADGQFVMYRHPGGLVATGGDESIQQSVITVEDAVIEDVVVENEVPSEFQEPTSIVAVPTQNDTITDGSSNTIIVGEVTNTPAPVVTRDRAVTNTPAPSVTHDVAVTNTPAPSVTRDVAVTNTPTPSVTRDRAVTNTPAPSVTHDVAVTNTPTPSVTRDGAVTDGSSNTVIVGEVTNTPTPSVTRDVAVTNTPTPSVTRDVAVTNTPTPSVTSDGAVTDGSSNTVIVGEVTNTPTPSPTSFVEVVPPVVIITIPPPFGDGGARVVILHADNGDVIQCQIGEVICVVLRRRAGNR